MISITFFTFLKPFEIELVLKIKSYLQKPNSYTVFPLSFHIRCKCRKKCESVPKFLQKCLSYTSKHWFPKRKKRSSCWKPFFFVRWQTISKKKDHRTADLIIALSVICGVLTKKKTNAEIKEGEASS